MEVTHEVLEIRTKRPFKIATGTRDVYEVVVCRVEHEGVVGMGEASPSMRVTGEDVDTVGRFLDWAAGEAEGVAPADWASFLDHLHDDICGNPSARCALDLAVHDLVGKLDQKPARALYDLPAVRLETCMTVSLDEPKVMAEEARGYAAQGFGALKLKLGDAARDVARVEAVRDALPDHRLRADANTAWTRAQALEVLPRLAALGMEFVEQPVPPEALDDLVAISRESPVPIYADESVLDASDVLRLHKAGFQGGINLKLQKCGGIRPAVLAARLARERGYLVQLGCMIETGIGISGALQLLPMLDHADLDGHLLLADDPFGGPLPREGWYVTPEGAGLGLPER